MSFFEGMKKAVSLNEPYCEFELLETERGIPLDGESEQEEEITSTHPEKLFPSLDGNLDEISRAFCKTENKDLVIRRFRVGGQVRAAVIFLTGMADVRRINDYVLRQAMVDTITLNGIRSVIDQLDEDIIAISDTKKTESFEDVFFTILNGDTVLLADGEAVALLMETPGFEVRSVNKPTAEGIIRGPQEAFTENLRTNITLVRKIVRCTDLVSEVTMLGGKNNLRCSILYRQSKVNDSLLKELRSRIRQIDVEYILGEGMLEQLIEQRKYSPFSQILTTERPDRTAQFLMKGCVAVICDGSPFVCVLPICLSNLLNSPEDIYLRPLYGTISRLIRYTGMLLSIFLPAIYVALLMYHPKLISIPLINTVLNARRMITMPIYMEILFMMLIFQIVRESGLRVPGAMGQTVSIIGGLLIGQASVDANLVSGIGLIVVALSGLGSYTIPIYPLQFTAIFFRVLFVLAAAFAGMVGLMGCTVVTIAYMSSVKSFGVPLLTPYAPKTFSHSRAFIRTILNKKAQQADYLNTKKGDRS